MATKHMKKTEEEHAMLSRAMAHCYDIHKSSYIKVQQ